MLFSDALTTELLTHSDQVGFEPTTLRLPKYDFAVNVFIGCTGWIRTSTYSINSRGEYPSRHGTIKLDAVLLSV